MATLPPIIRCNAFLRGGGAFPQLNETYRLNTANLFAEFIFRAPASQPLNSFTIWVASVAGTVTNVGTLEVFAVDTATWRATGAALDSQTFTPANGVQTITISTPPSLTLGTYYIVRIRNAAGDPTNNRFDLYMQTQQLTGTVATLGASPIAGARSADGGTTWAPWLPTSTVQLTLDVYGVHGNVLVTSTANSSAAGIQLYSATGTRMARQANLFNFDQPTPLLGILARVNRAGTPTFGLKGEVIVAGSVVATTEGTPVLSAADHIEMLFSDDGSVVYTAEEGVDTYLSVSPDGANVGDASNHYKVFGASNFNLGGDSGALRSSHESTAISPSWSAAPYLFAIQPIFRMPDAAVGGGGPVAYGHP